MYPTISHLIEDLTGVFIPLPIQSFGFFVALSFIFGAWIWSRELKRKERLGQLLSMPKKVLVGAPATSMELISNGLIGFIIGAKLLHIILDYKGLVDDPQGVILSLQGNLWGGFRSN